MDTKDWRLPNVYELSTILDNTKSEKPYAVAGLVHTSPSRYWSSTTDTLNTTSAWHVSFSSGYVYARSKTDGIYFCCVRGKQLNFDNLSLLKKKGGVKVAQEHVDKLSPKAQEIKAKKEAKERVNQQVSTSSARQYVSWQVRWRNKDYKQSDPSYSIETIMIDCSNGTSDAMQYYYNSSLPTPYCTRSKLCSFSLLESAANDICGNR